MREIKFRAWDKKNKRWATDYDTIYIADDGRQYIYYDGYDSCLKHVVLEISQYTGIKDRTGKEVFEGDIVRYDDYQGVAEVGFRRIEFVEEVEFKGGCFYPVCNQPSYTFEVIGNIYENKELLEGCKLK